MADSNLTKKALASAMKELMKTKPFSKISVGDICEACDMSRKSFYYHFHDKYELVNWIFYVEFFGKMHEKEDATAEEQIFMLCKYLEENREFYINALKVKGQGSFRGYFRELLEPVAASYIDEQFKHGEESEFMARFFLDALLASVQHWLNDMPDTSAERYTYLLSQAITRTAQMID